MMRAVKLLQAEYVMELRRNPQYYIYVTVLPTFLIVATTIAGMFLPISQEGGYETVFLAKEKFFRSILPSRVFSLSLSL